MGRHEIRLRRNKMTSRRIESHKNYYEVLKRHQRTSRMKRLVRLIVLLLFFIGLIYFSYSFLVKIDQKENQQPEKEQVENTSRPGD